MISVRVFETGRICFRDSELFSYLIDVSALTFLLRLLACGSLSRSSSISSMQKADAFHNFLVPSFLYNPVSVRPGVSRTPRFLCPLNHPSQTNKFRWRQPQFRQHFQSASTLCSSPSLPLPRTAVKYVDPVTSSTIYIIGCVHGSYVSAGSFIASPVL